MAERGLFSGVFARGGADTGDRAWLTAMLHTEAALARALERAGLAPLSGCLWRPRPRMRDDCSPPPAPEGQHGRRQQH